MTLTAIVRPEAAVDIREARSWYSDISPRLGAQFMAALDKAVALASEHPELYSLAHKTLRRALLARFPYALYYVVTADHIVIFGVLHQARDSDLIKSRL